MTILSRLVRLAILICVVFYLAGYFAYAYYVSRLKPLDIPADVIIVVTGKGGYRLKTGYQLLVRRKANKLFISGVNKENSPLEIQRNLNAIPSVFECCVELGYFAKNTWENGIEVNTWLNQHDYQSAILVTSNYHMPRAYMVLKHHISKEITLHPYPIFVFKKAPEFKDLVSTRWIKEYTKYLVSLMYVAFFPNK